MEDFKNKLIDYNNGRLEDVYDFITDILYYVQDYQRRNDNLIATIIDSLKEVYPEYIIETDAYHGTYSYNLDLEEHLDHYNGYVSFSIKKEIARKFKNENSTNKLKSCALLVQSGEFYSFYSWIESQVDKHNLDVDLAKEYEVFAKLNNYRIIERGKSSTTKLHL